MHRAPFPLESEWLGDHGDRQRSKLARQARNHRRRAGSGATAKAGRDEDHVGARQHLDDRLCILQRRLSPDVRIGPRAKTLGQLLADLDLDLRMVLLERLDIGIDDDELDTAEAGRHHPVDSIATATADANYFDLRAPPRVGIEHQSQPVRSVVVRIALSHVNLPKRTP